MLLTILIFISNFIFFRSLTQDFSFILSLFFFSFPCTTMVKFKSSFSVYV